MPPPPPRPYTPRRRFPPQATPAPPPSDYYQVLQVDPQAAPAVVAAAFRALLRLRHPDVSAEPLADAATRRLLEAYRTLSNPARRAAYDAGLLRRAARLTEIEHLLAPQALDAQRAGLAEEVGACAQDYERLWAALDGPGGRAAAARLERVGARCRALLREALTLPEAFDEAATKVVVPSGFGGAVGGYLAALEDALAGAAAAAGLLLAALRREHPEELTGAFAAFCRAAEQDEAALAPFRRPYAAALARARYVAAALHEDHNGAWG